MIEEEEPFHWERLHHAGNFEYSKRIYPRITLIALRRRSLTQSCTEVSTEEHRVLRIEKNKKELATENTENTENKKIPYTN